MGGKSAKPIVQTAREVVARRSPAVATSVGESPPIPTASPIPSVSDNKDRFANPHIAQNSSGEINPELLDIISKWDAVKSKTIKVCIVDLFTLLYVVCRNSVHNQTSGHLDDNTATTIRLRQEKEEEKQQAEEKNHGFRSKPKALKFTEQEIVALFKKYR